jgi:hypothetical protein
MTSKRRFLRSEVKSLRRGGRYSGIYSQTFVVKDDSSLEEEKEQTNRDLWASNVLLGKLAGARTPAPFVNNDQRAAEG